MSKFPSYATGTVSVAAGDTVIVGTGTIWSGVNARAGDDIIIAGHTVIVEDVTDATHLVIDPWPYATVAPGAAYKIVQRSPLRYAGGQAMADVSALVAAFNTDGFYVFVASTLSAPDPSYGNENQFAFQASTSKLWLKSGGAWVYQGVYKGLNIRGAYDNAATYAAGDVVASSGSSYVWSNVAPASGHAPPDPAFWQLLAAKGLDGATGAPGATGSQGAGYGGTSTTSLAIGTGAKAFTTQSGLAYQSGVRVRATSTADTTKWVEGVATYSGTTLTINVDKLNGSGTFASWNLNVAGQPGAGDLSSANNLSDLADRPAAIRNLGLPALMRSRLAGLTLSTPGSSTSFGIAVGVAADGTNVDILALPAALTKTTAAWTAGTGSGSLDAGAIAPSTCYHVFLIKRADTGLVDVLTSLSASAPTLPTNYTLARRIGSLITNASSQWKQFTQIGDTFYWAASVQDVNTSSLGTSASLFALTVPTGLPIRPIFRVLAPSNQAATILITSPFEQDDAPGGSYSAVPGFDEAGGTSQVANVGGWLYTNNSGQIRCRATAGSSSLVINTRGWVDDRGRYA